ncbi:MFS general substrate transporter [Aspergillus falconensis]
MTQTASYSKQPWGMSWRSSKPFIVTVIAIAMFTDSFLFSFIVPIMPDILEDRLHIPRSNIQFLTSIILSMNALLTIVIAPFTGSLSDKASRKNTLMIWSYAVNTLGTVVTAASSTLIGLIIGRLIQTIGGSLLYIAGMAMLGGTVGPEHLSKAMGICVLLISGGFLSAPALSAALFEFSTYAVTWLSAFVVLLVGTILQALVIEPYLLPLDLDQNEPNGNRTGATGYHTFLDSHKVPLPASTVIYRRMLCKRRVVTALVAETLLAALISSFEATIPLHIRDVFQWDSLEAGILFLVLQTPTMILVFPIGWLKDRMGMRLPVTLGFLVMAPSLWLLGVPGARQFQWAEGKTGEVLYVVMLVAIGFARTLVVGFGGVEVLRGANEVAAEIPGLAEGGLSLYSRAFVLSNITWKFGMFLGPLVSGALTKSVGYYAMNFVLVTADDQHPMAQRQTIALAGGTGDLGRYLHEELVKDERFAVALLTRKTSDPAAAPHLPHTTIYQTDYTETSIVDILNSTCATALISLIRCPNSVFVPLHKTLIHACLASTTCKRFIPSEWAGDIEAFPNIPPSYANTREPLRQYLQGLDTQFEKEHAKPKLQWTLFNLGWFMDYFLPPAQSYMKYLEGEFPIDVASWAYTVHRTLTREYRSNEAIASDLRKYESQPEIEDVGIVEVEQWQVTGATACPREKTLRQREKYFSAVQFMSLEEMLRMAETRGHV